MEIEEFTKVVQEEWDAMPEKFKARLDNLTLFIEDEPSEEIRESEGLHEGDTLLGLYQGIPLTERGSEYGVGMTLPDSITLYRLPILHAAEEDGLEVRKVINETIWHEVGHYMGLTEGAIHEREEKGTNAY